MRVCDVEYVGRRYVVSKLLMSGEGDIPQQNRLPDGQKACKFQKKSVTLFRSLVRVVFSGQVCDGIR